MMNLAEAMALAVLKGDMVAAYALADKLLEQRENPTSAMDQAAKLRHEHRHGVVVSSYEVYHWPEFTALCKRLNILVDLATRDLTISLPLDGVVEVTQTYHGREVRS
jgi:hypothetical protein